MTAPVWRSPITDLTGCLMNHQGHPKCGPMEMNMIDCLEAYGMDLGAKKCKDLIEDFKECATRTKQMNRFRVGVFIH